MAEAGEGRVRGLKVAVIGGSIAGCTMAIELERAGCDVTLFERAGEELKDRGAGIAVPPSVIETLIRRDLVDADTPCLSAEKELRIWRAADELRCGRVAWAQPSAYRFLNWGHLYRNLRKRLSDDVYWFRHRVSAVRETPGGTVGVQLSGGQVRDFELVVCADGHRSVGRRTLFPEIQPEYAGYVLWRGALAERALEECAALEGVAARPGFPGGSALFYLVPGMGGSVEPGARMVNWSLYTQVPDPNEFLTDKAGRIHDGSLSTAAMPPGREASLKRLAREVLPDFYAGIVDQSPNTFVHAVLDCEVPAYRRGRICLAGDAGALARPHAGSGALKGMRNAIALAEALRAGPTIEDALAHWSDWQTAACNDLVRLGRQLGRALVTEIPDWSRMDEAGMEKWFRSVVTVPSETFDPGGPGDPGGFPNPRA